MYSSLLTIHVVAASEGNTLFDVHIWQWQSKSAPHEYAVQLVESDMHLVLQFIGVATLRKVCSAPPNEVSWQSPFIGWVPPLPLASGQSSSYVASLPPWFAQKSAAPAYVLGEYEFPGEPLNHLDHASVGATHSPNPNQYHS